MKTKILILTAVLISGLIGISFASDGNEVNIIPVSKDTIAAMLEKRLEQRFVPGEVVVKMEAVTDTTRIMPSAVLSQLHLIVKEQITSGGEVVYKIQPSTLRALSVTDAKKQTLDTIAALKSKPGVKYAQPNYIYQITAVPNDPDYALQWHYFNNGSASGEAPGGINLPKVWQGNRGSDAVVVAVIDTGILKDHPDIVGSGNLLDGYDMISDAVTANDGDGRDADATDAGDAIAANDCYPGSPELPSSWHGTHVAGTIGVGKTDNNSGVAGINWQVKVLPVRVLGKCGGTMVDINDAIRWAAGIHVNGVPDNTHPAKVINMSLGGAMPCSSSPATQSAINDAVAHGATVVVAAGNDAQDVAGFVPGSCDNVVSVAASDRNGRLVTRYSNYGAKVDIMAPGGDVSTDTDNDGNPDGVLSMVQGGYAFYNGTSMAAPHVAGVAALMLATNPSLTPAQVESDLKAKAISRDATQCPKPCGAGLLNAQVALSGAQPVFALSVSPASFTIQKGKSADLSATLTKDNNPEKDRALTFITSDAGIASVQPTTVKTDAQGKAKATLTGNQKGNTIVTVSLDNTVSKSADVTVEGGAFSYWNLAVLLLLVLVRGNRRRWPFKSRDCRHGKRHDYRRYSGCCPHKSRNFGSACSYG